MKPVIRLNGVDIDWNVDFAKELCKISTGKSNTQDQVEDGKYPFYIRSENVVKSNKYLYDCEAVITIGDGNIGRVFHYVNGKFDLHQRCYMMTGFKKVIGPYFFHFFSAKFYDRAIKLSAKATVDSVRLNMIADMPIYYPRDNNEQKYIADYFKALDFIIQTTAKKITSLKQMKQACLVSMFPQEGETTPRVRFKGFKGEWLNVELSECLSVCKDRNLSETYGKGDVLSVSDDYGVVNQIELLGRSYAGKSVANYRILRNGHIVYTKSPLKVKPFGIIKVNNGSDGIVSTLYAVYVPMDWVSAKFINYYFEPSFRMNKYIHPLVNKGAKNDMKVSDENVLKGNIFIPKEKEEQQKIASYFTSLDKQISLQEARLEKLKHIKSACLDKMFV